MEPVGDWKMDWGSEESVRGNMLILIIHTG
jgi:hypothetical protein